MPRSGMFTYKAAAHSLRHRMDDGVFITGPCAYCGIDTIEFCPECSAFVCRGCDVREHWPAVGIVPEFGFVAEPFRPGRFRR
jgi:hypothetical protein